MENNAAKFAVQRFVERTGLPARAIASFEIQDYDPRKVYDRQPNEARNLTESAICVARAGEYVLCAATMEVEDYPFHKTQIFTRFWIVTKEEHVAAFRHAAQEAVCAEYQTTKVYER